MKAIKGCHNFRTCLSKTTSLQILKRRESTISKWNIQISIFFLKIKMLENCKTHISNIKAFYNSSSQHKIWINWNSSLGSLSETKQESLKVLETSFKYIFLWQIQMLASKSFLYFREAKSILWFLKFTVNKKLKTNFWGRFVSDLLFQNRWAVKFRKR